MGDKMNATDIVGQWGNSIIQLMDGGWRGWATYAETASFYYDLFFVLKNKSQKYDAVLACAVLPLQRLSIQRSLILLEPWTCSMVLFYLQGNLVQNVSRTNTNLYHIFLRWVEHKPTSPKLVQNKWQHRCMYVLPQVDQIVNVLQPFLAR